MGSKLCQLVAEDKAMKASRSSLDVSGHLEGRGLKGRADFPRGKSIFNIFIVRCFVRGLQLKQTLGRWIELPQRKQLLGGCEVRPFTAYQPKVKQRKQNLITWL